MKTKTEIKERIWLSPPDMGGEELSFIHEAFNTNWIAPLGPNVNGFESDLEFFLGENKRVTALSSGTAAIHLGLKILGVGINDIVICQSMTFVASVNPVLQLGAQPIFVDSEKDTWNLCPILLEEAIINTIAKGKKPKAIVAVHLYGIPYKIKEVHEIAKKYSIPILEDSAEALGSTYYGRQCGTFGDIGILSFNGNKIITTSGGGALICNSIEQKKKAIFLATQAKDEAPHYEHSVQGYNYRMSNVIAGIGRGQSKKIADFVEKRRANFLYYKENLESGSIQFLDDLPQIKSNRWLTCILISDFRLKEKIREALTNENIECRPLWKPMHLQPLFKGSTSYTNGISEDLFKRGLCLPSGSSLKHSHLGRIVTVINEAIGND